MATFPLLDGPPDITEYPTAPTLADWQYRFQGLTWGSQTTLATSGYQSRWAVDSVTGLDMPPMRSGNVGRPRDQGEFAGIDLLAGRDITLTLYYQGISSLDLRDMLTGIESAMIPALDGITEKPLWFQRPGQELMVSMVRPRKFGLTSTGLLAYVHQAKPVLLFHSTGALLYGPTQETSNLLAGSVAVTNAGPMPMWPYFVCTGPLTEPWGVSNGVVSLSFTQSLASSSDIVYIDFDVNAPTAVLYESGVVTGSYLGYLVPGSAPFAIQPGSNTVEVSSGSGGAGSIAMQWADAFVSAV